MKSYAAGLAWRVSLCAMLWAGIGFAGSESAKESAIRWQPTLEAAFQQAKSTSKPLFVDVYADWCGWCKKLEKDVFTQSAFARMINERFIAARVDADANRQFSEKYAIEGLPTLLVLEADGRETGRIPGYMPADALQEKLEGILKGRDQLPKLKAALAENPDSASAWYNAGMMAWDMDRYAEAVEHLNKALTLDPEHRQIPGDKALLTLAQSYGFTENPAEGAKTLERLIQRYPQAGESAEVRLLYGTLLVDLGELDRAQRELIPVVEAPKDSVPESQRLEAMRLLMRIQMEQNARNK